MFISNSEFFVLFYFLLLRFTKCLSLVAVQRVAEFHCFKKELNANEHTFPSSAIIL